jgi:hypothetical protein
MSVHNINGVNYAKSFYRIWLKYVKNRPISIEDLTILFDRFQRKLNYGIYATMNNPIME